VLTALTVVLALEAAEKSPPIVFQKLVL